MKQFFFLALLVVLAIIAINRPQYSLSAFFRSFNDFEDLKWIGAGNNGNTISNEKAFSGKHSCKLDADHVFSFIYQINASYLKEQQLSKIRVNARVFTEQDPKGLYLILQVQKPGQTQPFLWVSERVETEKKDWKAIEQEFLLGNRKFAPEDEIAIYFWNKEGKEIVFIDDVEVKYF